MHRSLLALFLLLLAQDPPKADPAIDWVKPLTWRCIGPANMAGRVTALSVFEADPSTYWVATASGGLVKTVNNGMTFTHQFDREATVSIGDVCVAPSNRDIVWVGTGEANPRNSVSYGDGVYKSVDGGKSWKRMGLEKTFQIGRVVVHPANPDIVYVGALGRLYGPNPERGLFKTADGGKSWERVLFVDEKSGVIDVAMSPADPDTLLVATWEHKRDEFDSYIGERVPEGYDGYDPITKWGPGSKLFKTTDGAKSFTQVTKGLPTCLLGRMGIDYYRKDPKTVFLIVDCEKIGMGTPPKGATVPDAGWRAEDAGEDAGARVIEVAQGGAAEKAGIHVGDVVKHVGEKAVKNQEELGTAINALKPDDKVALKLVRDEKEMPLELTLGRRLAAGSGFMGVGGEDAGQDEGAKLTSVNEGGPAEKAGLKVGDVIRKIGGKAVKNYQEFIDIARASTAGEKVEIVVARETGEEKHELTFGQRPGGGGGALSNPKRPYTANYGGQRENVQDQQGENGFEYGGVYKSTDGGDSWTRVNSLNPRPMYFSCLRVDPSDDNRLYMGGVSLYRSSDGGKTFRADAGRGVHADHHALWIDPRDGRHMIVGSDGGFYVTYDRTATWDHLNTLALGQFYHVAVCTKKPYWVYGGLQDNGSWGGPSVGLHGSGPVNEDWVSVGGGDGFVCRVDPNDPDLVYSESQNGVMGRRHLKTGERASIRPPRPASGSRWRFNWNTPFLLSSHNSRIFYTAGNVVFRSVNRGDDLRAISPEITLTKRGSATALAESPKNPDVLWVGTDDGALWITKNGGKEWTSVGEKVGLAGPRWVATIEASRFVEGRAYVCFDGHRSNDDEPALYVTEDFGQTWKPIRSNLPAGSSRCLREDVKNQNLLFAGTEFAIFVSLDRGATWTKLNNNLPTVAVHEIAVHPTVGEIVVATHGRSLWILDISGLRQVDPKVGAEKPQLYKPDTATRWETQASRGRTNRRFVGQNPPFGAQIYYSIPKKAQKVDVKILDIDGAVLTTIPGATAAGFHKVGWDLTRPGATRPTPRRAAPAGAYRVVLTVDGQELSQSFKLEGDSNAPGPRSSEDDE